jgi:hypothetical protein
MIRDIKKQVRASLKPLEEVGEAIINASTNCRDAIKGLINAPTEKERQQREIFIFYEFIYFYMHLTMRQAFASLPESSIKNLQGYLGPLISSVSIDSYFAHWPNDLKKKMTDEFYDKLNDAELEYAACTYDKSSNDGEERMKNLLAALFMKLASNVADLAGGLAGGEKEDVTIITPAMQIAIDQWEKMQLGKLITEVKRVNWEDLS